MNDLLLLLIGCDAGASARLAELAEQRRDIRVRHAADEADFWSTLHAALNSLRTGVMVVSWGMPAEFVRALKSDGSSSAIPVVACLPPSCPVEPAALYDAGANCVVEFEDGRTDLPRLHSILEFWSRSAILPRGARAAHTP